MTPTPEFLEQYIALTERAGWAELPGRTIISVTGADRIQFLHSFTTNDIKKLAIGDSCEAFVTTPQGKTLGHVFIFCDENRHILDTAPDQAKTLIAHFERYVITEDVLFTDQTGHVRDLLVAGPAAAAVLKSSLATLPVTIRPVPYAGLHSFFVQAAADEIPAITAALTQAGAVRGDAPAVEAVRLEAGFPLFGSDITPENLPQEVARDKRAVSFLKGCYLGQETVARIDAIGHVNRLLVGLKFAGNEIPLPGTSLLAGDQPVGHVTSAAWSPGLAAPLALGYVRRSHATAGTQLRTPTQSVEVVGLPLPPHSARPLAPP